MNELQFHYGPGNNRRVQFTLSMHDGTLITGALIRSYARLLLVLATAKESDAELPEMKQGWRSYDQLMKKIESYTDWPIERPAIVQMLSRIGMQLKQAAVKQGSAAPDVIERYDGAARLSGDFRLFADPLLRQLLLPEKTDVELLDEWSNTSSEILDAYGVSPADRRRLWNELIASLQDQIRSKQGFLYSICCALFEE